jgi:predicted aldo/keto reductase-like oxidoreductase
MKILLDLKEATMTQHSDNDARCSRRSFFKTAGALGISTLLTGPARAAKPAEQPHQTQAPSVLKVPTRPFGKSGRRVSILSLGGMFDMAANYAMLKQAVKWGVTYWDTADCYQHGSETGIGKYFTRSPQDRQKIFLVTKSDATDPEGIQSLLDRSLERMNTSYIDLYFLHGIGSTRVLTDDVRSWAEKAKAQNKIKLFGFSTHRNMAECLMGAAGMDWIDGIMMTYNVRNMSDPGMQEAVAACAEAGIGLTAMKTQAGFSWFNPKGDTHEAKLVAKLQQMGWTPEQAKLKAVWQNPHIASICSQMDDRRWLKANVEAASDPTPLSREVLDLLNNHMQATADQYCAGCSRICESTLALQIPVCDIMRYHMYNQSYGRPQWAKAHFRHIPYQTRRRMVETDYTAAENKCPQGLPIGRLMHQAYDDFG